MTVENFVGVRQSELSAGALERALGGDSLAGYIGRSLMVCVIAGALLGVIAWRFFGVSEACRPSDLSGMETMVGLFMTSGGFVVADGGELE